MKSFKKTATGLLCILLTAFFSSNLEAQRTQFLSSPYYHIDIGLNFTGTCSPEEGAAFSQYGAISSFNQMRFVATPSASYPCWLEKKGKTPFINLNGDGSIVSFQICPDYDPDPRTATIKHGPVPFLPLLTVMDKAEVEEYLLSQNEIPVIPLVPSVYLRYSDNFSVSNPELQWETEVGKGVVESRYVVFSISLAEIGKGKDILLQIPYKDGKEAGTWDIRILPVK
jgi:hypothetical protein